MQFRKDINGLRAIAVLAVVLFHFNSSWMPGGFAGVDVFFVISGFLMTGVIFRGIEQENFSILKFYVARANRIVPALAVLSLVLLVFGWFYLTPLDYKALGKHVASSMGFLSNVIYWKESSYFDAASHEKWLLHTWSLSVEWQFYIIYPLVLVAMRKFMSLKAMKAIVLIGTVLGFIFCVIATYKWPNPAYYLLPTRGWEMMIGGVAYLYPIGLKEERKKLLEWFGFALIITSFFFISKDTPWPGYLAIFPVLGSFLIIQAQRNDSLITSNIFSQKIGAWSYSIYLWHWPIVVAIYYFSLNAAFIYLGVFLSVFLGYISNKYIERIKFRGDFGGLNSYLKCKPIYMVTLSLLVSSSVFLQNGFENRFGNRGDYVNEIMKNIVFPTKDDGYCFFSDLDFGFPDKDLGRNCFLNDTGTKKILLFGSSYAGMYEPFWKEFAKDNNWLLKSLTSSWCAPYINQSFPKIGTPEYKQCLYNREYISKEIESYDAIVLAGLWAVRYKSGSIDSIKETIDLALSKNVKVIIMPSPVSYRPNPMVQMESYLWRGKKYHHRKNNDVFNQEANNYVRAISANKGVYFVDRSMIFDDKDFYFKGDLEMPYTLDGGHISQEGALHSYIYLKSKKYDIDVIKYIDGI